MSAITEIRLIGRVEVVRRDGTRTTLSRKAAALFAYLALEGNTHRARIASLLWPETTEAAAKANLRQLLLDLHGDLGVACVVGIDFLRIAPATSVDVRDEPDAGDARRLLARFSYDDCEAFAAWLASEREQLRRMQVARLIEDFVRVGQAI